MGLLAFSTGLSKVGSEDTICDGIDVLLWCSLFFWSGDGVLALSCRKLGAKVDENSL